MSDPLAVLSKELHHTLIGHLAALEKGPISEGRTLALLKKLQGELTVITTHLDSRATLVDCGLSTRQIFARLEDAGIGDRHRDAVVVAVAALSLAVDEVVETYTDPNELTSRSFSLPAAVHSTYQPIAAPSFLKMLGDSIDAWLPLHPKASVDIYIDGTVVAYLPGEADPHLGDSVYLSPLDEADPTQGCIVLLSGDLPHLSRTVRLEQQARILRVFITPQAVVLRCDCGLETPSLSSDIGAFCGVTCSGCNSTLPAPWCTGSADGICCQSASCQECDCMELVAMHSAEKCPKHGGCTGMVACVCRTCAGLDDSLFYVTHGDNESKNEKHGGRVLCADCALDYHQGGPTGVHLDPVHDDDVAGLASHGCDGCDLGAPVVA